jgi:hypothetical protein
MMVWNRDLFSAGLIRAVSSLVLLEAVGERSQDWNAISCDNPISDVLSF